MYKHRICEGDGVRTNFHHIVRSYYQAKPAGSHVLAPKDFVMLMPLGHELRFKELAQACLKNNGKAKEIEIEEAISDTLKYAPSQHRRIKYKEYKVPDQKKKDILFRVEEETNSES